MDETVMSATQDDDIHDERPGLPEEMRKDRWCWGCKRTRLLAGEWRSFFHDGVGLLHACPQCVPRLIAQGWEVSS